MGKRSFGLGSREGVGKSNRREEGRLIRQAYLFGEVVENFGRKHIGDRNALQKVGKFPYRLRDKPFSIAKRSNPARRGSSVRRVE